MAFVWLGLAWLSYCCYCCWMPCVVDEKRYFPQCLTETCNQQLKTSETSIFVVCTNNKLYFVRTLFSPSRNRQEKTPLTPTSGCEAFFRFGYFISSLPLPFFLPSCRILTEHDDDIQRKKIIFFTLFHFNFSLVLFMRRALNIFRYHNLFQYYFFSELLLPLQLPLSLVLLLLMSCFFFFGLNNLWCFTD